MFKSDRNTGKRKCIKNRKQILTIPEIREKKIRINGKDKSGKIKSQIGQYARFMLFRPKNRPIILELILE